MNIPEWIKIAVEVFKAVGAVIAAVGAVLGAWVALGGGELAIFQTIERQLPTVVTADTVAYTSEMREYVTSDGVNFIDLWTDQGLILFNIPRVPEEAQNYTLPKTDISCPERHQPITAWHEVVGSWPAPDVMYSVNADVTEKGDIQLALRARQRMAGYAYIEVYVLCTYDSSK